MALVEIKFTPWSGKASLQVQVGDDVNPIFRLRTALEIVTKEAWEGKRPRADLTGADLTRADLTRADLTGADLTRADLTRAVLTGADLTRAILTGADLTGAILTDKQLRAFKADFWSVLLQNKPEVPGLIAALREGRVDGSTYTGACACLVGTIANVRGVPVSNLERDCSRPAEQWFLMIRKGDKPGDKSGGGFAAAKALAWAEEFCGYAGVAPEQVGA